MTKTYDKSSTSQSFEIEKNSKLSKLVQHFSFNRSESSTVQSFWGNGNAYSFSQTTTHYQPNHYCRIPSHKSDFKNGKLPEFTEVSRERRKVTEDPAGYVDGLNLYNAYFGVNGVDPTGLYTIKGMLESFKKLYGDAKYKDVRRLIDTGTIRLGRGDFTFDDWKHDDKNDIVYINDYSYFWREERTDDNAAEQLYEALVRKYGFGARDWGTFLWDVPMGSVKAFAGYGTATFGYGISASGWGAIPGVPLVVFGSSTGVEGVTQIFGRSGGINFGGDTSKYFFGETGERVYYAAGVPTRVPNAGSQRGSGTSQSSNTVE